MINAQCAFWALRGCREYQGLWPFVSCLKIGLGVAVEECGELSQAAKKGAWRVTKSKQQAPQLRQAVARVSPHSFKQTDVIGKLWSEHTFGPINMYGYTAWSSRSKDLLLRRRNQMSNFSFAFPSILSEVWIRDWNSGNFLEKRRWDLYFHNVKTKRQK